MKPGPAIPKILKAKVARVARQLRKGPRLVLEEAIDRLNFSQIATVVCVPLTSNLRWADAPGNVLVRARVTGLPKDSVANGSQILTVDRSLLTERAGKAPRSVLQECLDLSVN